MFVADARRDKAPRSEVGTEDGHRQTQPMVVPPGEVPPPADGARSRVPNRHFRCLIAKANQTRHYLYARSLPVALAPSTQISFNDEPLGSVSFDRIQLRQLGKVK